MRQERRPWEAAKRMPRSVWLAVALAVPAVAAAQPPGDISSDPQVRAGMLEAQAQAAAAEALRNTAGSRQERMASRTKYRDLGAGAALSADRAAFPEILDQPPYSGPVLRKGEQITGYLSDYSARLRTAQGMALVTSTVPLRVNGRPLDLALQDGSADAAPANPAVPSRVGQSAQRGFAVDGLAVSVVGTRDAAAQRIAAGRFYAAIGRDLDMVLRPIPTGIEALFVRRSPAAADATTLRFTLPRGARLRAAPKPLGAPDAVGPAGIEVVRDDEVLATIPQPVAYDAQGKSLAAHLVLDGADRLTVQLDPGQDDSAFPQVIDPAVSRFGTGGTTGHYEPWTTWANGPFATPGGGSASSVGIYPTAVAWSGANAGWWLSGNNSSSFIYQEQLARLYHSNPDASSIFGGIWANGGYTPNGYVHNEAPLAEGTLTVCSAPGCPSTGVAGEGATFGLTYYGQPAGAATSVAMYATQVFESDDNFPAAPSVTRSLNAINWYDSSTDSLTLSSTDAGLGMKTLRLAPPGLPAQSKSSTCDGSAYARCAAPYSAPFSYSTNGMPEGRNTVTMTAEDAITHPATATFMVNVDHSAPTMTVTGDGWPIVPAVPPGKHSITVSATDGSSATDATARSGVATIDLRIDGKPLPGFPDGTGCPSSGNCSRTKTGTYDTADYAPGPHLIYAMARDELGHESVQTATAVFGTDFGPAPQCGLDAQTVVSGYLGSAGAVAPAYVGLRAEQAGDTTNVCWQFAGTSAGNNAGTLEIDGATLGGGSPDVDFAGGACVASGGSDAAVSTTDTPFGTVQLSRYMTGSGAWVCLQGPGLGVRLILAVPGANPPRATPYLASPPPAPPAPAPWPAKASAACANRGGPSLVNMQVGGSHVWLASQSDTTGTRVCAREQDGTGAGDGGVLTVAPPGVPVVAGTAEYDKTYCPDLVFHQTFGPPAPAGSKLWIDASSVKANPVSVCVDAGAVRTRVWAGVGDQAQPRVFTSD